MKHTPAPNTHLELDNVYVKFVEQLNLFNVMLYASLKDVSMTFSMGHRL